MTRANQANTGPGFVTPRVPRLVVFSSTAWLSVAILLGGLGGAHARADESALGECAPGNVMDHARLARWLDTTGPTARLTDGNVVPEDARWPSQAVTFTSRAGSLTYDLGSELTVGGLFFQGEGAVDFTLLLSADGTSWQRITLPRIAGATGMRSRAAPLEKKAVRFVRVGEPSKTGAMATEMRLYCDLPPALDVGVLRNNPAPGEGFGPTTWTEGLWWSLTGVPPQKPFQPVAAVNPAS
jgi:hypothetical protein